MGNDSGQHTEGVRFTDEAADLAFLAGTEGAVCVLAVVKDGNGVKRQAPQAARSAPKTFGSMPACQVLLPAPSQRLRSGVNQSFIRAEVGNLAGIVADGVIDGDQTGDFVLSELDGGKW